MSGIVDENVNKTWHLTLTLPYIYIQVLYIVINDRKFTSFDNQDLTVNMASGENMS